MTPVPHDPSLFNSIPLTGGIICGLSRFYTVFITFVSIITSFTFVIFVTWVVSIISIVTVTGCKQSSGVSQTELKKLAFEFSEESYNIKQSLNDKELIITFDDGPIHNSDSCDKFSLDLKKTIPAIYTVPQKATSQFGTSDLIDYLNYHRVPATFFVVTSQYYDHRTNACSIQRIIHSPHLIVANHTWTHTSINFLPKTCDNSSTISLTDSYRPLPDHWNRLFSHDVLKKFLKIQLSLSQKIGPPYPDISSTNSQETTSPHLDSDRLNPKNDEKLPHKQKYQIQTKGLRSIFPRVGKPPHYVSLQSESSEQTKKQIQTSSYPGFTNFITNEIEAAGCYLNQYILLYSPDHKTALEHPLFYRPPGGFWELEDKVGAIDHPSLEGYIGPIGWHFGGSFNGTDVSDFECWDLAKKYKDTDDEENRSKLLSKARPEYIKGLKEDNPIKGCADAYVAHIESQPIGQRKGIVLLHDSHPQSIRMFIEYLHPQLEEKGYKFVGLDDVSYVKGKLSEIHAREDLKKQLGSCLPAKDEWCATNHKKDIHNHKTDET